jgi:hypothetical protein
MASVQQIWRRSNAGTWRGRYEDLTKGNRPRAFGQVCIAENESASPKKFLPESANLHLRQMAHIDPSYKSSPPTSFHPWRAHNPCHPAWLAGSGYTSLAPIPTWPTAPVVYPSKLLDKWKTKKSSLHINPFTASCENAMSLSEPGVPAPCEKFSHSNQLNFE